MRVAKSPSQAFQENIEKARALVTGQVYLNKLAGGNRISFQKCL